ncbi:AMP-dependent synthetase/ligase [Actinokineospora bangkokensis]|uniref:Acyl-CoA synthetase n=1 Tax=Actinokineospora bangkokensis TaxID=1193682 RepID=A0A1Q9LT35_9PSEU|nr:AMP-dependent synthetase/ligase [Actinokineospora bangkokensis]OLR95153.1 long-chain fatty acid--CoA ligase [Actinokineospora bangkokensis]
MSQFSGAAGVPVEARESLVDVVWANAERFADAIGFRRRVAGTWVDVTTKDFAAQVLALAKGFAAAGLAPGDRVAVLSRVRWEWTLVDLAAWAAGCVVVPVPETASAEQVAWQLRDCGARAVVVEDDAHRALVEGVVDRLADVTRVWRVDPGPATGDGDAAPALDELVALGAGVPDAEVHRRRLAVGADDLATLVYTAGTTGRPRGVELTHGALLARVRGLVAAFPELLVPGNSMLQSMSQARLFARVLTLACVHTRTTLGHLADSGDLASDLATFRPTFVAAGPRVFERVRATARRRAAERGRGALFDLAEGVAVRHSEALATGGVPPLLSAQKLLARRLLGRELHAVLGGRCQAALSCGGALDARLAHFFRGAGIPVHAGYGLTEASSIACATTAAAFRAGTAGRPLPGVRVRVDETGEVLLGGDGLFRRYWRDPAATAEALVDGWLRTGDLGSLDPDGYLRITGRLRDTITTADGRELAPSALEDRVRRDPLVSQCVVVGDGMPHLGALITVAEDALAEWAARAGKRSVDVATDPDLRAALRRTVDAANRTVPRAAGIAAFAVLATDFSEAAGELTPAGTPRREAILKSRADEVAGLFPG